MVWPLVVWSLPIKPDRDHRLFKKAKERLRHLLCSAPNWSAAHADSEGSTLWGTWYITNQVGLPFVATIFRDGALVASDATDFGGPPFPFKNTPQYGVWTRTGAGTFEATAIYLRGDMTTGEFVQIVRTRLRLQFGDDFDHISGDGSAEVFQCSSPFSCPDPLTAEPDATSPLPPFQGTRLRVEP